MNECMSLHCGFDQCCFWCSCPDVDIYNGTNVLYCGLVVRFGVLWCGMFWCVVVWCVVVCCGMVWYVGLWCALVCCVVM
jgi:hypothetical protein